MFYCFFSFASFPYDTGRCTLLFRFSDGIPIALPLGFESMYLCWFFGLSDIYFCLSPLVFNPGDSYRFFLSCFLSGMFFPFSLVWLLLMGPMDSVVLRFSVKFDYA